MIYDTIKEAFQTKPQGQGLSEMQKWKMVQPGFIDIPAGVAIGNMQEMVKSSSPYAWDGTFNQPTLPLTDTNHRSSKMIYRG